MSLLGTAPVDWGITEASLLGKIADVEDHAPHVIIVEDSIGRRHAGGVEAVFDDPFQLAVGVSLYPCAGK